MGRGRKVNGQNMWDDMGRLRVIDRLRVTDWLRVARSAGRRD